MRGRIEMDGSQVVKWHADPARFDHEMRLHTMAAAAGCAPAATVALPRGIRMPRLIVLGEWLDRASKEDRKLMAISLVECIERLHSVGICHRDIHRDNVVVDGSRPLLIDFEIATRVDPSFACYDLFGPASRIPVPVQHIRIGLVDGVWWDSPSPHVRAIARDLGTLAEVRI